MAIAASYLLRHLAHAPVQLGQVCVFADFSLIHVDDADRVELDSHSSPHAAIEIARYDGKGAYRPLKAAPNLRRGWRLSLSSIDEVILALEFLYPAALGSLIALEEGSLLPVPLRQTLSRQTGMYAVVKKISDDQAREVISDTCNPEHSCRRRILWSLDDETPSPRTETTADLAKAFPPGHLPILCAEACNYFVAAGRKIIKAPKGEA